MEFVTGKSLIDAVDYKATKGKIIFFPREGDSNEGIDVFTGKFMLM